MADDRHPGGMEISGSLIGWERHTQSHGVIMTLQVADRNTPREKRSHHRIGLALDDRQLGSLARDLIRAAQRRGIDLRIRPPLHRRVWTRLRSLTTR